MKIFLNLLPPEKKQELRRQFYAKLFLWQWFSVFLIGLFCITVLATIYGVVFFRQKTQDVNSALISESDAARLDQYESSFEETNDIVRGVLRYEDSHTHFTHLLKKLDTLLPDQVILKKVSTKDYQVFLTGVSKNRDELISFQESLKNEECFESVNAPVSNLFAEQDVSFEIDFKILPECLQGTQPKL